MHFRSFLYLLPFLVLHVYIPGVAGQNMSYVKTLMTELFTTRNYDTKVRPVQDSSTIIEVDISFYLKSIIELDEVSERLVTSGYVYLTWTDSNLIWDPTNWDGINQLVLPQNDVWKPDVVILNSIKDYKELGNANIQVRVFANGRVLWSPIQVFETACSINIQYFPYDEQKCTLKYGAWSYSAEEILMLGGDFGINLDQYKASPIWDVIDSSWSVDWEAGEAAISFNLHLKRKPLFVILSTVAPIIMLSFLNILVFVLPNESGEKSGYAVTVFLALAVFLTIISTTLPENSDSVSLFSMYVTAQIFQSTLITTVTLIQIRLSSLEDNSLIPNCLVKLTKSMKHSRCRRTKRVHSDVNATSTVQILDYEEKGTVKLKVKDEKPEVKQDAFSEASETPSEDEGEVTWQDAMVVVDIICAVIFTIFFVATTSTCLLMAQYHQ